ncbi:MAG: DUF4296 domain-containing protein [Bacteroidaceae bacterium]|nr:DUF4296 domain-containing protein [Bacteroidaceae bacterium]
MRHRAVKTVALLLLVLLVSCKVEMPKSVLPPEKMEAILYDYHLTESMTSTFASVDYKEKLMYIYVYEKHHISKEMLDSSLVWYSRYPKHLKEVYKSLEARLQSEVDSLAESKVAKSELVDLDMAYLAPDVAELWTGHPVKMLTATPLGNKINFSFDVPKDSSFVVGDSLVLSFKSLFVARDTLSVKQEAYAAITLEYSDDAYSMAGVSVKKSGNFAVAAPRNVQSRLRSMSGYIYYFDNDTANSSKLILSGLSLKRIHAVQPAKKEIGQK